MLIETIGSRDNKTVFFWDYLDEIVVSKIRFDLFDQKLDLIFRDFFKIRILSSLGIIFI